jgi:hypothetical protein
MSAKNSLLYWSLARSSDSSRVMTELMLAEPLYGESRIISALSTTAEINLTSGEGAIGKRFHFVVFLVAHAHAHAHALNCQENAGVFFLGNKSFKPALRRNADVKIPVRGQNDAVIAALLVMLGGDRI